ncbi:hypothetical protein AF957_02867 [Listeria monocytogenes]|nr:hypothetical protein AF957_02867 [Listeria monocytogenes]
MCFLLLLLLLGLSHQRQLQNLLDCCLTCSLLEHLFRQIGNCLVLNQLLLERHFHLFSSLFGAYFLLYLVIQMLLRLGLLWLPSLTLLVPRSQLLMCFLLLLLLLGLSHQRQLQNLLDCCLTCSLLEHLFRQIGNCLVLNQLLLERHFHLFSSLFGAYFLLYLVIQMLLRLGLLWLRHLVLLILRSQC